MIRFCVAGSLNMDMSTRVTRFPAPGETISGISFGIFPGGKGANQAVALSRLGAHVTMIGALGDDVLGRRYAEILDAEGVNRDGVSVIPGESTGTATITVNGRGENSIIIVPGANARVTPELIRKNRSFIEDSDFLLLQLEIPVESTLEAARIARASGTTVILDPAPAVPLPDGFLGGMDIVTPNETEAMMITGRDTGTDEGIRTAGAALLGKGAGTLVIKAGRRGAFLARPGTFARIEGFSVNTVDTVAAGDSFNAGLAFALGLGMDLERAVRFANAVGALSTTGEGAQGAMPRIRDVEALLGDVVGRGGT